MNLNNITLTPEMLAGLYPHSLVDMQGSAEEKSQPRSVTSPLPDIPSIKFLGENHRHIVILVSYPIPGYLPDEAFSFLTNILNACKINLPDAAIINLASQPGIQHDILLQQLQPKVVLLFDIDLEAFQLPFRFPPFQVQAFDQCTYLSAPSLSALQTDKSLKEKLWFSLQKIFLKK